MVHADPYIAIYPLLIYMLRNFRLHFLDRHSVPLKPEAEYHMTLPDSVRYKDVHGGMIDSLPELTDNNIQAYMDIHKTKWGDKVQSLYKER